MRVRPRDGDRLLPLNLTTSPEVLTVLHATNPQHNLWEAILPEPCLRLPAELAASTPYWMTRRSGPLPSHFDPCIDRPSVPVETYLRMIILQSRYRLGYELLGREVADSIS